MEVGSVDVGQSLASSGSGHPGASSSSFEEPEVGNRPDAGRVPRAPSSAWSAPPGAESAEALTHRRGSVGVWVAVAIYLGLGVLANLPSWIGGVTHTMQVGGNSDPGQEVWFLAWAAHALIHLQDPLRTNLDQLSVGCRPGRQHLDAARRGSCCSCHPVVRSGRDLQRRLLALVGQLGHGRLLRPPSIHHLDLRRVRRRPPLRLLSVHDRAGEGPSLPAPRPHPAAHLPPAPRDRGAPARPLVAGGRRRRRPHDHPAGVLGSKCSSPP